MNLAPYQARVVDEKAALDEKTSALTSFIGSRAFKEQVQHDEADRMIRQRDVMVSYSAILGERIAAFTEQPQ